MADGSHWPKSDTLIGGQEIILGDCIDILSAWKREQVDLVVTSPPYNLNLSYSLYEDSKSESDYVNWLADLGSRIRHLLKPDGSFFLNITGSNSRPYVPFEIVVRLRQLGFHLQNHIVWIKSIGTGSGSSGHFKPIPGRRFMHHNHEHIFHLTLKNDVDLDRLSIGIPFQDKSNIARRGHARDLRCRGNTWFIPYQTVKSKAQKFWHPATFPVELPLWCIYLHGRRPATILDPFVGTGTSLVAAHFAGAFGIGIDIDPTYLKTARQRITKAVEETMIVVLNQNEMEELFRQDSGRRDDGGFQRKLVSFQDRLNKTTGELPLSEDDVEWIKKWGAQPEKGSWQKWVRAAFGHHIDMQH